MNWTHEIISYMLAFFVGIGLGKAAGASMPSLNLSWTWTPVALVVALVLPSSVGAPVWITIFGVMWSVTAMVTYAFSEVAGRRERGQDLNTPLSVLRERNGRVVVTVFVVVFVILAMIHRPTVADVPVGVVVLAVMWGYYERHMVLKVLAPKVVELHGRTRGH